MMNEIVFTTASVLGLLTQIDELGDLNIGITETIDGQIQLQIGNSTYILDSSSAEDIIVPEAVVEDVSDTNMQAYEDLSDSGDIDLLEPVESGMLSELAKSLMLGGMIRLSGRLLK